MCLVVVCPFFNNILNPPSTLSCWFFSSSHFLSLPPFSQTIPCEFSERKASPGNALSALRFDPPSDLESFYIYLFFLTLSHLVRKEKVVLP